MASIGEDGSARKITIGHVPVVTSVYYSLDREFPVMRICLQYGGYMDTLTVGALAYYDSFAGLLPCRVTAITGESGMCGTSQRVTATLTAHRGAWRKGEQVETFGHSVCPRSSIVVRAHQYRIRAYAVYVQV